MSYRVTYVQKNGSPGSATFPTRELADSYARSVRKPSIEETGGAAAPVAVKVCPIGTADMQRAASRAHYETDKLTAEENAELVDAQSDERAFERDAEFWGASLAAGQCRDDAWKDFDYVNGRRR